MIFEFGEFEIDTARFELRHRGEPCHLEPQVFDVLRYLVEHRDRIVPKEELLDNVWGDRFVSESALTSRIKAARQAVGDDGRAQRVISTAHGRGYRFVATTVTRDDSAAPSPTDRGTANTLPADAYGLTFLGRSHDLQRVAQSLGSSRLVTLTGPGGVGKTRLALEVARHCETECWFVDLSQVTEPGLVARAVLDTLGVSPRREITDCDRIVEALEPRSVLLVIDNCEQVVDAVTEIAGRISRSTRDVRVLATSRQPLNVTDEHILLVAPLTLPPATAPEAVQRESDAVRLFCDRAERAGATVDDLPTVVALCRRLDGIPLALELAAARMRAFSATQILEQLEAGWSVSVARRDHGPAHHQSLHDAIDWSYQLLDRDERSLLLTLGVFRGAFDLAAAAAVSGCDEVTTADRLLQLTEKSLVQSAEGGAGRRFRLLETVRAFTISRVERTAANAARERHAFYFANQVETLGARVPGPDEDAALAGLTADYADAREAFGFAVAYGDAAAVARLAGGPRLLVTTEGARWAQLALRAVEVPGIEEQEAYPALLGSAAWAAVLIGDLDRARALALAGIERAGGPTENVRVCWIATQATGGSFTEGADACLAGAARAGEQGDIAAQSFLLATASIYRLAAGDERVAVQHAQRGLELAREIGSRSLRTRAAGALAHALQDIDGAAAKRAAEEVLEIATPGDFHRSMPQRVLAILAWRAGDYAEAADHATQAAYLIRDQGDRYVQATSIRQLAVLVGSIDQALAAELLGVAQTLVPQVRVSARDAAAGERLRAALLGSLGDDGFAASVDRGRRQDTARMYAIVGHALGRLRAGPQPN